MTAVLSAIFMISYNNMKRRLLGLLISIFLTALTVSSVQATSGEVLGVHILNTNEIDKADTLLKPNSTDSWRYVTIPLSLADLEKKDEWLRFFETAQEKKLIPIVRLVTKFENGAWQVPSKKDVVDLSNRSEE